MGQRLLPVASYDQRVQWMFETREMYQTHEEILEKSAMFTGAFYSILELDGNMVDLDSIPDDWATGSPYRGHSEKEIEKSICTLDTSEKKKGNLNLFR